MCLGLLVLFLQAPGATPAPCLTPSPHHLNTERQGLSAPTKPPLTPCPTLRCPPSCSTHGASLRAESPLGQRYPHHTHPRAGLHPCGARGRHFVPAAPRRALTACPAPAPAPAPAPRARRPPSWRRRRCAG